MVNFTLEQLAKYKGLISFLAWAVIVWILMFADTRYTKTETLDTRFSGHEARLYKLEQAQVETNIRMQFVLDELREMANNQKDMHLTLDNVANMIRKQN